MGDGHEIYGKPLDDILRDAEREGSVLEYRPGDSIVHRLNPITKMVVSVGLVAIAFLMPDFRGPLLLVLGLASLTIIVGVHIPVAKILAFAGTPLAVALIVIQGLVFPGNVTEYFIIEPVPIIDQLIFYEEGLLFALLFLFRVLTLMFVILLIILTTHPKRLTTALIERGVSSKFAYVFLAALQLIPLIQDRAKSILDAQQARGLDTKANIRQRFKSITALFIPLTISMLIATETRALALESRGFTKEGERTALFEVPDTTLDRALRIGIVPIVLGIAIWRYLL